MAITVQMREQVSQLYVALFGRAPDGEGLGYWVGQLDAGRTLVDVANTMYATAPARVLYPSFLTNQEIIGNFYTNVLGRTADAEGLAFWTAKLNAAGATAGSVIAEMINTVANYSGTDPAGLTSQALFNNKVAVAQWYGEQNGNIDGANTVLTAVTSDPASVDAAKAGGAQSGQTFTLTAGADNFTGTAGNDTFTAAQVAAGDTWTVGDKLDGGAGNDTLNVTTGNAIALPTGATVTNIETVNLLSGATVELDTTTGFAGLTKLTAQSKGGAVLTAAATTAIEVTNTDAAAGSQPITVNGGSSVAVTSKNNIADVITVGATTAAAGEVTVTSTGGKANGDAQGAINVTGGTKVTVNQYAGNAGATGVNTTGAKITVTGNASTTEVVVNQTKTATGADATATAAAVVGYAAGDVDVLDANRASNTAAGTIETVSITNAKDVVVNSGALKTLNLGGVFADVNAGTLGALTTPANTTLALNLNGAAQAAGKAVTIDTDITTLNLAGNTAASTLDSLVANGAKTVNISGDAKVTLTGNTFGALESVVVTNTAGASLGTALAATVSFTGGAGADSIILSNAFEKAITMGDGDDTVTYGGAASTVAGKKGSVDAGAGKNTIKMSAADAATASADAVFNGSFKNFQVLDVTATTADRTVNLAGINGVNEVVARGIGNGNALTLDGFKDKGTLTLDSAAANASGSSYVANITNATLQADDTFNVALNNSTGATVSFGKVTLAGVENVNISTVDKGTAANTAATQDAMVLVATSATKIVVAGNNGLDLTNTGNTKVTSFDASGVVANGTDDTAAALGVKFTSANNTTTDVVTITGGDGNDVLIGGAAKDTIVAGKGNDIVAGGLGADTITVGVGRDVINVTSNSDADGAHTDSGTSAFDQITGFKTVGSVITNIDLQTQAKFIGATAGGTDLSILNITALKDDGAGTGGTALDLTVEGNATGVGQAIGVNYEVKDGLLKLSGTGASTVDTLGKWLTEVAAVAATAGDTLAFEFGNSTYVFVENGAQDVLVQLVGVTGSTGLVEVTGAANATAAVGSILFGDSLA